MKTRISYIQKGTSATIDVDSEVSGGVLAKRVLAAELDLLVVDADIGQREDIDSRLSHSGIDPDSVTVTPLP
ncbi:hypothetical protein ABRY95_13875 [Castellaniella ginsengisoli]|uniref:Uncharacterized protein n=1 Tax=Castellaniella ginsengisoli TaxID=546114 RepID=A0AB39GKQ9_9BURK